MEEQHVQTSSIRRVIDDIESLHGAAVSNGDTAAADLMVLAATCLKSAIRLLNPPSPSPPA